MKGEYGKILVIAENHLLADIARVLSCKEKSDGCIIEKNIL